MKSLWKTAYLFLLPLILCGGDGQTVLLSRDIGKEYKIVRKDLIKRGDAPVDQTGNYGNRNCMGSEIACKIYPELISCAVDEQSPCRFEWRSGKGARFYIVTTGEDPLHLIVRGMDFDTNTGSSFYSVKD